jgi:tetratricopeptide (TPR) repeat protein
MRAKLAAARTPEFDFAQIIQVSIEIELPGGRAEMQVYAGGERDQRSQADLLIDQADELLDKSRFREAITLYQKALEEHPKHTHALVNLAAAHAGEKDFHGAYQAAAEAAHIEPNYPLYRRTVIHYLSAQGCSRVALEEFLAVQREFPNLFDFNDVGAELLLACGKPESALACAQRCILTASDKDKLITKARAAVEGRSKAQVFVKKARALVEQHADSPVVLASLEKARALDPYDPLLGTNLALTLARTGKYEDAIPLLLHAANHGPYHLTKVCYANAAFCLMEQGKLRPAMVVLGLTMDQINFELKGRPLENLIADLPGKGIWVDEQRIIEEKLDSAARLVVRCVRAAEKESKIPEEAASIASLYAKVTELPKDALYRN